MGMLPSLSRIIVAMLGFVAVLVLHETLVTTTGATQVASSVDTITAAPVDRDETVEVAVNDDPEVAPTPDVSAQEDDTPGQANGAAQIVRTDVVDAGADSDNASSDGLQNALADEPVVSEQVLSSTDAEVTTPNASPTPVAIDDSLAKQWSAVWRPFFSPTTAEGFANYISESTGLTLRVQPSQVAGHYLVEVQHNTEAERIDADRRIVEYTGFKPPGAVQ